MLREGQTRQVSTPTREGKRETRLPLETKPVRCSLIDSLIEFSVKINDVPVLKIHQFWGAFLICQSTFDEGANRTEISFLGMFAEKSENC